MLGQHYHLLFNFIVGKGDSMNSPMSMNNLILVIGIPGAGKTTSIKKYYEGAMIISPDNFIGYTKENPWTPKAAKEAWKKADKLLREALKEGSNSIVFDATFISPKVRRKYINLAIEFNYVPVAFYCVVSVKTAQVRNLSREEYRRVPGFVMRDMSKNIIPPSHEEGFKKIFTFYSEEDKLLCSLAKDFKGE